MLSRIAQARQGFGAGRRVAFAPATSPLLRARPAAVSSLPYIRTYAKNRGKQLNPQKPIASPPPSQKPTPSPQPGPSFPAAKASQPQQDDIANSSEQKTPQKPEEEPIPFHKLPDLTQGIPSTLEQEAADTTDKSQASLQAFEGTGGGQGRDRSETYVPTSERNRRWWARFMLASAAGGSAAGIMWLGRGWDDDVEAAKHPETPNGWSPTLWYQRVRTRWQESKSYYQDPEFEKLLPDPDPSFERPYTLCLSLEDLLVYSEWSRDHGWRLAKRPGLDYFIRYLSQYYELVLFTTTSYAMGEPVVQKLDPFRFIMWPLFREATKFEDGEVVKDLSYLNRDLSKVMIIDTNASHVRKQPENAIVLSPWKGDPNDKELVALIPFLEYIHTMQYDDVRKVLKSFDGKHIPSEFARREAIARKEFNAQREKAKHSKPSGVGALGSMLGLKPSNMSMTVAPEGEPNPTEAFAQGKMLQDIARERGQRNYELLEREIRQNGEMWLKEQQEAMEKAQAEAMSNMAGSFSTWFTPADKSDGEKKV